MRIVARETERILGEFSVARLGSVRRGFVSAGGHSLFDPEVTLHGLMDVLGYLPRGLAYTLFAPFPRQWFDTQGTTGLFKSFAAVEVITLYLLLPLTIMGALSLARSNRCVAGLVVLVVGVATASLLSLAVANAGTLFRLRMQGLLPLLVIAAVPGTRGKGRRPARRLSPG